MSFYDMRELSKAIMLNIIQVQVQEEGLHQVREEMAR
jgi:hypothetical protein